MCSTRVKRYIAANFKFSLLMVIQFVGGIYYYEEEITQPYDVRLPNEPALQFPLSLITFTPVTPNYSVRQLGTSNLSSLQSTVRWISQPVTN